MSTRAASAALWTNGLAEWGQRGERILRLAPKLLTWWCYARAAMRAFRCAMFEQLRCAVGGGGDDAEALRDRIESRRRALAGVDWRGGRPVAEPRAHSAQSLIFGTHGVK